MFIGTMEEGYQSYPKIIQEAVDYLKKTDFKSMENGKIQLKGDKMYAIVQRYQSRTPDKCRPETHKKYIDIQYIVEGEESMGWCPLSPDLEVSEAYNPEKDVAFYKTLIPESNIILEGGSFAVFYPEDVHMPCGAVTDPAPVTKVVVKIAVDLLD